MTKIPKNYILDLTNSRHFTGRSQSSLGSESQSTKNCGTAVAPKDFRIFFTAQLVDLFLDNMSATTFSLVVFRGTWTMCTVVPRNVFPTEKNIPCYQWKRRHVDSPKTMGTKETVKLFPPSLKWKF